MLTAMQVPRTLRVRPAVPDDAVAIADAHVRSWQAAYRGLVPQEVLDGLDPRPRYARLRERLATRTDPRAGTLVVEDGTGVVGFADGTRVVGFADGAGVVGFADYAPSRDPDADPATVGEIPAIYLAPPAWGTGAGRTLMAAAVAALADAGYTQATLWVMDSNARARRFYERAGWRLDGGAKRDELHGVQIDEVRYRRALP